MVPRKHNAGGQSKERFARGRDEALKHWLKKVAEIAGDYFNNDDDLIIGGPGMTKDRFVKGLSKNLSDNIIRVESVGYTCEAGLHEMLGKSRYV